MTRPHDIPGPSADSEPDELASRYAAFVCYDREADAELAGAIQRGLQRFARPFHRRHALRVAKPEPPPRATPWPEIARSIFKSQHLVLVASPAAAHSPEVTREISRFLVYRDIDHLIIAVADGEIGWDETWNDFDSSVTDCIPPILYGKLPAEPAWIDLRPVRQTSHVTMRNPLFRDVVADLAAPIHGIDKDVLVGTDIHTSRKTRKALRWAFLMLTILLLVLGVGTWQAVRQAGSASRQLAAAEQERRTAIARQLDAQADARLAAGDPRTAAMLGIAAQAIHDTGETQAALIRTVLGTPAYATLSGHHEPVTALSYAPNGRSLVTAGADDQAILWDLTMPQPQAHPMPGHTAAVQAVAYSADGRTVATASADRTVRLWDVTQLSGPRPIGSPLRLDGPAAGVAFTPDGDHLAVLDSYTLTVWDLASRARVGSAATSFTGAATALAIAPDGRHVAGAAADGAVLLWDIGDPAHPNQIGQPLGGIGDAVTAVAFAPKGATLAVAAADRISLWNLANPGQPTRIGAAITARAGGLHALAFSRDGHRLAAGGTSTGVLLWDISDRSDPRRIDTTLTGQGAPVTAVAFAPDGQRLATGATDRTAMIWDLAPRVAFTELGQPISNGARVGAAAFAPSGRLLAVTADTQLVLWDPAHLATPSRLSQTETGHSERIQSLVFAPSGNLLATAGGGQAMLWDVSDPTAPAPIGGPLAGHTGPVTSVAFAPDAHVLATGGEDGKVLLWDITDPTSARAIGAPLAQPGSVAALGFAPDGKTLAVAAGDRVTLWTIQKSGVRTPSAPLIANAGTVAALAYSPDGRTLATANEAGGVVLWDVHDPAVAAPLGQPLAGAAFQASALNFGRDGRTLAAVIGDRHTVAVWDVTDPARPLALGQPLPVEGLFATSVALSPDGKTAVIGNADWSMARWDLADAVDVRDHAVAQACAIAGRGLNPEEWARYLAGIPYVDTCGAG